MGSGFGQNGSTSKIGAWTAERACAEAGDASLVVASPNAALPYVYGDWGRFYGRVDTFGVRTLPWGQGHIEAAVRVSTEGWSAADSARS